MRAILITTLIAIYFSLTLASFSVAGDVPVPKQDIKYDNAGPYAELVGMWTGNLSASTDFKGYDYQHRNAISWDFSLYVISANDKTAKGIYCWSAVGTTAPDCREINGTFDTAEGRQVFQWGERTLTLSRKAKAGDYHQVTFQKVGGGKYEALAKKKEQ
jgi:hypothetical protein